MRAVHLVGLGVAVGMFYVMAVMLIADAIALRGCEEVCIATHMGDN